MKKLYRKYKKIAVKKIKSFKIWDLPILIISIFVIFLAGISIFSLIVKAEITNLYPGSCLGGWINTQNAQGRPTLDSDASADLFNDSNSAILKNTIAQIFCGSFNGQIPQDNEPKKVFLKFSWSIVEKQTVSTASSTATIIGEIFASSTPDIIIISEPLDKIEFILIAPETATGSPNLETEFPSAGASSTSEILATSTPDVLDSGEFLEISYTLNSADWIVLGRINRSNWRDAKFELPITNWADIQKVQIGIQTILTVDEQPIIYLDSIWLEVLYESENLTTAISGFFGIKRSDEKTVFISRLYSRSPSGDVITSPLQVKVYMEDFVSDTLGCGEFDYWGVAFRYKNELGQPDSKSKFIITPLSSSSVKNFNGTVDLPPGEITQTGFSCWQENLDPNAQDYDAQENSIASDLEVIDFETSIFKIIPQN